MPFLFPFYYLREICSFEGQEKVDRYKLGSIDHLCVCVCARVVAWYSGIGLLTQLQSYTSDITGTIIIEFFIYSNHKK